MAIETEKFIRKPLYVEAVRITSKNFDAIVAWCQGEVMQDDIPGRGRSKKYIKVDVQNPKNPRQTKGKVGDWILKTDRGYKIYTDNAFHESFHTPEEDPRASEAVQVETQIGEGLISPAEELVPGLTLGQAVQRLREEFGTDISVLPATPESIAEAVKENGSIQAVTNGQRETNGHGEAQTVEDVPEQEKVEPTAAEGKRVLSVAEQQEMDAEEIRDLLQAGEAVLAQDIAAA